MPTALERLSHDGTLLILSAAILIYIVARTALDVISGGRGITAGQLAIANAFPVLTVACVAAWNRQADLALAIVLGSTVAALTLVLGLTLTGEALGDDDIAPSSRAWQFLLPTTLMLMLVGFGGRLTLTHAAMLLAMGVLVSGIWREGERTVPTIAPDATEEEPRRVDTTRWLRGILAVLLGVLAGWLAMRGGLDIAASRRGLSPGVVGVTVISAMLALPATGYATLMARTGRTGMALASQVGTAMLLLTLVLPATITVWYARGAIVVRDTSTTTTAPTPMLKFMSAELSLETAKPLPFSIGLWRIEAVLLVALALPVIPVALGRWKPTRAEGAVLIVGYVLYLGLITAMGTRWH